MGGSVSSRAGERAACTSDIRLKTANDLLQSPEIHLNRSALVPSGDKRAASVINFSDAAVGKRRRSDIKE